MFAFALALLAAEPPQHVVVVAIDGLRAEEVLTGAEGALLSKTDRVRVKKFWRDSPNERREALMPFLWKTIAHQGQVFGNGKVTNPERLSFPGYNEMLTGAADPRVHSNQCADNPNVTVLEWLNGQPALEGKVQVFASWGAFFRILNVGRSRLAVHAGWNMRATYDEVPDTFLFDDMALDAVTFLRLKQSLEQNQPRVLFLGLTETDDAMHAGRYDLMLDAAHQADGFIEALWTTLQSMPQYRGTTTLLITTDHGRGHGPKNWRHHDDDVPGSELVWFAALGPGVTPLGVNSKVFTLSQVAATIANAAGFEWRSAQPNAAPPIVLDERYFLGAR